MTLQQRVKSFVDSLTAPKLKMRYIDDTLTAGSEARLLPGAGQLRQLGDVRALQPRREGGRAVGRVPGRRLPRGRGGQVTLGCDWSAGRRTDL